MKECGVAAATTARELVRRLTGELEPDKRGGHVIRNDRGLRAGIVERVG